MASAAIFSSFFQEHNLMIKNKMALLGAVATLGMVGGGFVSPAQAIVYNVSGQLADGNALSGSFDYSPNTYTN